MDKNTNTAAGVKSVEKKLGSKASLLGANQEFRRPSPPLMGDDRGTDNG